MRKLLALAACATAALTAWPTGAAQAEDRARPSDGPRVAAGWHQLANSHSRKCLTIDAQQNWDGGRVYLANCATDAAQRWYRGANGDRVVMTSAWSGRVLDAVLDNRNGSAVTGYRWLDWDHYPQNQQWRVTRAGEIKNAWNGRCLDANPGQKDWPEQQVYLWDCNGSQWQRWFVV